jgi:GAF domain-containing protein
MSDDFRAAAAAGVLAAEQASASLLQSTVEVARAIFSARAASIFLLDEAADELVFEAVAGEGEGELVGRRLPSSTGIAGWVLVTRQPLVLEDVTGDPRFARDAAESTGYVPRGLMAVPLLHGERALGVLQVLDPDGERASLAEVELLGLFAGQAATGLELLERAQRARELLDGSGDAAVVARLAALVDERAREDGDTGARAFLESLEALLRGTG